MLTMEQVKQYEEMSEAKMFVNCLKHGNCKTCKIDNTWCDIYCISTEMISNYKKMENNDINEGSRISYQLRWNKLSYMLETILKNMHLID